VADIVSVIASRVGRQMSLTAARFSLNSTEAVYLVRHIRLTRFPRDLLATSSRGCHDDATRKTASVEFELNPASTLVKNLLAVGRRQVELKPASHAASPPPLRPSHPQC